MRIVTAVIGCGNISRFHFNALEKYGAQIKWVCDLNKESAQPWMDRFSADYTADYMDIINDAEEIKNKENTSLKKGFIEGAKWQ